MSQNNINNYYIANIGVLTYFIPRVHVSVDEAFLKQQLENFWTIRAVDRPLCFLRITRVEFVPYENNPSFNKVFVYHQSAAEIGRTNEVVYQTRQIFEAEERKAPLRCNFFHHGKNSYWLLLPNLNPLTMNQQTYVQTIRGFVEDIIDNLSRVCNAGLTLPHEFDLSVLDQKHIETAFRKSLTEIDNDFKARIEELREQKRIVEEILNINSIPSAEDEERMEQLAREEEEESLSAASTVAMSLNDDEEEAINRDTRNMWNPHNTW